MRSVHSGTYRAVVRVLKDARRAAGLTQLSIGVQLTPHMDCTPRGGQRGGPSIDHLPGVRGAACSFALGEGNMGFYIRKSISAGPFRFNLSRSGVGMSVGVMISALVFSRWGGQPLALGLLI